MKFYEVEVDGETVGCETSMRAAKALAKSLGDSWCITIIDAPVNAETIRRLLGNLGGYAETLRYIES